MALYTSDKLQKLFNESKLRQEKQKEERKRQKQLAYRALCRKQDVLIKKALRDEKKKVMDNLSTLIKKTPQKGWKQPQIESNPYYQDQWQLWEPNESDLFQSIDELKEWEEEHHPCINWDVWNQLVEQTKKEIEMLINQ